MTKPKDLWDQLREQPFDFGDTVDSPQGRGTVSALVQTVRGWLVRVELDDKKKGHWIGPAVGVKAVSPKRKKKR